MDCRDYSENLQAYIDDELSEMEREAIEGHLKDCPACTGELRELVQVNDLLTKSFAQKPDPAGMMAKVIAGITEEKKTEKKSASDTAVMENDASTRLSGKEIGGYSIVEKIGSGGMGTVYKATQISMNRDVALKVLFQRYSQDDNFVQRFIREARSAGALNHGNIVRMYDVGQAEGFHYMSMEFVQGRSVQQILLDEDRLAPERALDIVIQTARALEHAHRKSIIHRDIKPENIIINGDGHVKVADLGLAKQIGVAQDASMTVEGQVMGTPQYMSPEQVVDSSSVDHRTDIYSLGATFYFMVTGERPFEGKSAMETMVAVIHDKIEFTREQMEQVPKQIVRVIEKMTRREPDKRYQTAADLLADLEMIRNRPFTYASAPAPPKPRAVRAAAARREREPVSARDRKVSAFVWLAALAAGVLLIIILFSTFMGQGSEPAGSGKSDAITSNTGDKNGSSRNQRRTPPPPPKEPEEIQVARKKPEVNGKAKKEWEQVLKLVSEHPEDYAEQLSLLKNIFQGYPSSRYAEQAQNLYNGIIDKLDKKLAEARGKADGMKRKSDYNEAIALWLDFEKNYAGTEYAELAASYRSQLVSEQNAKYDRDMKVAAQKLEIGDRDGAIFEYEKVARYGTGEMKKEAASRIASVEASIRREQEEKKKRQQLAMLEEFYRGGIEYMMEGQYSKAIDAVNLFATSHAAGSIEKFVELEKEDINHMMALEKALNVAFEKMANSTTESVVGLKNYDRPVVGRVEEMSPGIFVIKPSDKGISPLISLDMKKLTLKEVIRLAGDYLPDKADADVKYYLLYLYEGELDTALAMLDEISGRKREFVEEKQASGEKEEDLSEKAADASKKLEELMKKYGSDEEKLKKEAEKLGREVGKIVEKALGEGKKQEPVTGAVEKIIDPGDPKYAIHYQKYEALKPIIGEIALEDTAKKLYDAGKLAYRKRDYEEAQYNFERLLSPEYEKTRFLDDAKREEIAGLMKDIEAKQGKTLTGRDAEKDDIASLFHASKIEKLKSGKYRVTYDFTTEDQLRDFRIRREYIEEERIKELFGWSSRANVNYEEAPNWAVVKYQKYNMINGKGNSTFTWKGMTKGDVTIEFHAIPLDRDNVIALLNYSKEGTYVLATSYRGGDAEWHREHFGLTRTVIFRRYWDDDPSTRLLNGGWQVIGNAGKFLVQPNTPYTVKAMKVDNKLTFYLNKQRFAEGVDNTWSKGYPGVWTQESHVLFTNIKITGELDPKWVEEEMERLGKKKKEEKKDKEKVAGNNDDLYKGASETTRKLLDEASKIDGVTREDLERIKKIAEAAEDLGGEWGRRAVERFAEEIQRIDDIEELRRRLDEIERMINRGGGRPPGGGGWPGGGRRPGGRGR